MRKLFAVIILAFCLTGCADKSVFQGGTSLIAPIENPITITRVYQLESALLAVVTGLNAYKRLCVSKTIDQSCRGVIKTLQSYIRRVKPILKSLRAFVRNNDQVNAITAFNAVRQLIIDFQGVAVANGVTTASIGI